MLYRFTEGRWRPACSPKSILKIIFIDFLFGVPFLSLTIPLMLTWELLAWFCLQTRSCCGLRDPYRIKEAQLLSLRKRFTPKPLPNRRTRVLSFPEYQNKTSDQHLSMFFSLLPFEIRRMIYEYTIYGEGDRRVFHMLKIRGKIGYWQCRRGNFRGDLPCSWSGPCSRKLARNVTYYDETLYANSSHATPPDPETEETFFSTDKEFTKGTGLLVSCRRIYFELIPILYTQTHFHFAVPIDIVDFCNTILQSRLDSIQCISLDWASKNHHYNWDIRPTRNPTKWSLTWDLLASMKGLRELRIYAKFWQGPPDNDEVEMEEARHMMRKVKGLALYELVVPRGQLQRWKLFVAADMEITLAVRPTKRMPREARGEGTVLPRRPNNKEKRTYSEKLLGTIC